MAPREPETVQSGVKVVKTLSPDPRGGGNLAVVLSGEAKSVVLKSILKDGKNIGSFDPRPLPITDGDKFTLAVISGAKSASLVFCGEGMKGISVPAGSYEASVLVDGKEGLNVRLEVKDTKLDAPSDEKIELFKRRGDDNALAKLEKQKSDYQKELVGRVVIN